MGQEMQVSTVNDDSDTFGCTQDGREVELPIAVLPTTLNKQAIPPVSNTVPESTVHEPLQSPNPIFTAIDTPGGNAKLVPEFYNCQAQIGTKFGCIPLTPIYVYKGCSRTWDPIPDVLTAHRLVKNTGIPICLGLHIPVKTNLNVDSLRKHLADYFDQ